MICFEHKFTASWHGRGDSLENGTMKRLECKGMPASYTCQSWSTTSLQIWHCVKSNNDNFC